MRVDSGVRAGDSISIHYDPMIAKLIVWDRDRAAAVRRLARALEDYEVAGVATNIAFLLRVAAHPDYAAGNLDTAFISLHAGDLLQVPGPAPREVLAAAVLRVLEDQRRELELRAARSGDPWSPWNQMSSWRMNTAGYHDLTFRDGEATVSVRIHPRPDGGCRAEFSDGICHLRGSGEEIWIDGVKRRLATVRRGNRLWVIQAGVTYDLQVLDGSSTGELPESGAGALTAPMPGRITQLLVTPGTDVKRGAGLIVLEAMKMEYTITAPADGRVEAIRYAPGDLVSEGAELLLFTAADDDSGVNRKR